MEEKKTTNHKGWAKTDDNKFYPHVVTLIDNLEPGYYEPGYIQGIGYTLNKLEINDRNLIKFPGGNSDVVTKDIRIFWDQESEFRKYKFPYKRGILLYGPPGCSKSCTISQLTTDVIAQGGIVIKFTNYAYFIQAINLLRKVHPDMPVVVLMEELDQIIFSEDMSELLNLLDGVEKAVDKVVFLATTNRIDKLPENIKNRPSRFDRRVYFGPPTTEVRSLYFQSLFEASEEELNDWVNNSENFSFAHMKELFTSVKLLGNDFKEVVEELKLMQLKPTEVEDEPTSSINDLIDAMHDDDE